MKSFAIKIPQVSSGNLHFIKSPSEHLKTRAAHFGVNDHRLEAGKDT